MNRATAENGGAGLSEPRRGAVILRTFELERRCHLVQKTGRAIVRLTRCHARDHIKKRPPTLASILQGLAAAEITDIRHSRDFRSPSIFDFFNNIGTFRKFRNVGLESGMRTKADVRRPLSIYGFTA
jgi:hypothetical protein